jgi:lysophospholipase L1-like esterase
MKIQYGSHVLRMVLLALVSSAVLAAEPQLQASKESYDYAPAMKDVAKKFKGKPGVLVLLGDSITYANQNTAWAFNGQGQTPEVKAFLKWSHVGEGGDADGWTAAKTDVENGRSHTASSGVTTAEYLAGGKHGLPPLSEIIKKYNPQMAIYMLGTNDMNQNVAPAAAIANVEKALDALMTNGTVPILSTIPPMKGKIPQVEAYNAELKKLAEKKKVPLLDLFSEMKAIDADMMTFLTDDGVHLSYDGAANAPTPENFKKAGYLCRCYFNVMKAMEVKAKVIDAK